MLVSLCFCLQQHAWLTLNDMLHASGSLRSQGMELDSNWLAGLLCCLFL